MRVYFCYEKDSDLTRIREYINQALPWAHQHQSKGLTAFAATIFEQ
jgi:hypothetical protein